MAVVFIALALAGLLCLGLSGAYSRGILSVNNGTIDLDTTATKIGLATSAYTPDPDESNLTTFATNEPSVSGYTGGFGGSGRKSASVTLSEQTANNRVVAILSNLTWTALGTGGTLAYAVWLREVTNDAASIPISYLNFSSNLPTNGSDVLVSFDGTNGNVRWNV
jgi:hypothetical protein